MTAAPKRNFAKLDPDRVSDTIDRLYLRINERFPNSSLSHVASDLKIIASETLTRVAWIRKPNMPLRVTLVLIVGVAFFFLVKVSLFVRMSDNFFSAENFIQSFEAILSIIVFLGVTLVFVLNWESRIKQKRAVTALHELKILAHIVDMHQLTKDPEIFLFPGPPTASSPIRNFTPFELSRYLDYCSEILSIVSKIATLYVHDFRDPVVIAVADQIEDLTTGLTQKIWQKTANLERIPLDQHFSRSA